MQEDNYASPLVPLLSSNNQLDPKVQQAYSSLYDAIESLKLPERSVPVIDPPVNFVKDPRPCYLNKYRQLTKQREHER